MKKTTILLIGLFAFLSILILRQEIRVRKLKSEYQIQSVKLSQIQDTVFTYINEKGELISKINSIEIDKNNLKESLAVLGIDKKSLEEQNIKLKNLVSVLQLKIKTFGEGQTNVVDTFYVVETDTFKYQKVNNWTDSYLSLFNARIENSLLSFQYDYFLDMNLLVDRPKKNTVIVTAKINNPNISSINANSVTVSTKRKWYEKPLVWGIAGLGAGIIIAK